MTTPRRAGPGKPLLAAWRNALPQRLAPLHAALTGLAAGAAYWLSAQLWPASIAVALAMLVATLCAGFWEPHRPNRDLRLWFFYLLLKFSALMALSAAKLPFSFPANAALGWIMLSALMTAAALAVSGRIVDHAIAFALGFTPAVLLGVSGLVGLAVAISTALAMISYRKFAGRDTQTGHEALKLASEVAFYLGAVASWSLIG